MELLTEAYLPRDQVAGCKNLVKAALLRYPLSLKLLYQAYYQALSDYPRDRILSLHYCALATAQGSRMGYEQLASWFLSGAPRSFEKFYEFAYAHFRRAADLGSGNSLYHLGFFHARGLHGSVDLKKAKAYYEKAARAGNKRGLLHLALIPGYSNPEFDFGSHLRVSTRHVQALQDCENYFPDWLGPQQGDIITVLAALDDEVWYGSLSGQEGFSWVELTRPYGLSASKSRYSGT